MKKRHIVMSLVIVVVVGVVTIWLSKPEKTEPTKPYFKVTLKEPIYVDYGVDINVEDNAKFNIIESHVVDELESSIPIRVRYEYHIDNSEPSFNYQERAKALE